MDRLSADTGTVAIHKQDKKVCMSLEKRNKTHL